jgi:hypothetical protein
LTFLVAFIAAAGLSCRAAETAEAEQDVLAGVSPAASGVIHLDMQTAAPVVLEAIKADPEMAENLDLNKLAGAFKSIESVDLELMIGPHLPPLPTIILKGSMTPQTLVDIASAVKNGKPPVPEKLPDGNGRYLLDVPLMLSDETLIIYGKEADDVDDGIMLLGAPVLLREMQQDDETRQGATVELRRMVAKVDTSRPIWGAISLEAWGNKDEVQRVLFSGDVANKGALDVVLHYTSDAYAKAAADDIENDTESSIAGVFTVKRDGSTVTLALSSSEKSPAARLQHVLARASRNARRDASRYLLTSIHDAMQTYRTANDGRPPDSLDTLVEAGDLNAEALQSPSVDGPDIPQPHYVYTVLPADAPEDLLSVYEKPEINDNKGTNVLRHNGSAEWVAMDTFKADLAKTRKWLAENK